MLNQKITPFFWYDHQAEEAANFYTSIFPNSKVGNVLRQGENALTVSFSLNGQSFTALNGGPIFKFNPSISTFVLLQTEAEVDAVWEKLSEGGMALMPLDKYDWSAKYGWVQDKYGLTWQVSIRNADDVGPMFTPSLLFTGPQRGQAKSAIDFYTSIFSNSGTNVLLPYGSEHPENDGLVMYANFKLQGQNFIAMDNGMAEPNYTFNEAVSLVVNCENQAEVDKFWEILTADGGAESQCGWLKDKFGVSWQIVPEELPKLLTDPDPGRAQRAMGAMMLMRKIDLEKMRQAADDDSKKVVTVAAIVDAPVGKVWDYWSAPEHIMQWNSASPDWHTPRAENDLRKGGNFSSRMEAKDGSMGFDFGGIYDEVVDNQLIEYTMGDGRKVSVHFSEVDGGGTHVIESFEAENTHPVEFQQQGWQSILDNFKKYVESN